MNEPVKSALHELELSLGDLKNLAHIARCLAEFGMTSRSAGTDSLAIREDDFSALFYAVRGIQASIETTEDSLERAVTAAEKEGRK